MAASFACAPAYDVAAMQLWFARGSEVSIREQLVTQVMLGILSDDLAPGQRLPSTRELARRFQASSQHRQRGISATAKRPLGRVPPRQRRLHSRHQAGDAAHPRARARSNDCAPVPLGTKTGRVVAGVARAPAAVAGIAASGSFSAGRAGRRAAENSGGGNRARGEVSRPVLRHGRLPEDAGGRHSGGVAQPRELR